MLKYISLDDVERYSTLTSSDARRYAHLITAHWAFDCPPIEAVIGGFHGNNEFRGCGLYEFSGWLGLSDASAQKLLKEGKLAIRFGQLIDRERSKMRLIQQRYPFSKYTPNEVMCGWGLPYELDDYKALYVFPKFGESESIKRTQLKLTSTLTSMLGELLGNAEGEADMRQSPEFRQMLHDAAESPKKVLFEQPFELTVSQLGIARESLAELERAVNGTDNDDAAHKSIDAVMERLYLSSPNSRSNVLWERLRQDVDAEDNEKVYDLDLIILEMGEQELVWQNRNGDATVMARQTFKNRLSKRRKPK